MDARTRCQIDQLEVTIVAMRFRLPDSRFERRYFQRPSFIRLIFYGKLCGHAAKYRFRAKLIILVSMVKKMVALLLLLFGVRCAMTQGAESQIRAARTASNAAIARHDADGIVRDMLPDYSIVILKKLN